MWNAFRFHLITIMWNLAELQCRMLSGLLLFVSSILMDDVGILLYLHHTHFKNMLLVAYTHSLVCHNNHEEKSITCQAKTTHIIGQRIEHICILLTN